MATNEKQPLLQKELRFSARQRRLPDRRGFTLVEVLVAVTILSIALLAYVTVAMASRGAMDKGADYAAAAQAAGDKIADLQGTGFSSLTDGTTSYTLSGLRQGVMKVVIGPLDGNSANINIKQIDVTVTWAASSSKTAYTAGNVKYTALVSNR